MINSLSDISLVTQVVVLHNKSAFDQLVRKYQSQMRRFFLNQTCGDKELSDDLAQDTFIKAYTSLTSFKGTANFTTWLYRIAYNVFFDYIRSQKPTSDLEVVTMDADYSHEQQDISKKMDVYAALQQLREAERTCITLFYMEELEIKKIAEITGMAEGTVKSHLSRGKEKMANYLKQNGYGR